MKTNSEQATKGPGLLAIGSSRCWDIAVDEAVDRDEWSLEIDGPQVYLVFQLDNLDVLPRTLRFLESGLATEPSRQRRDAEDETGALTLGRFGSAAVSLLWDNEDFPRCFLVVGPRARATLRLSFEAEDIRMLIEALRNVVKDLPATAAEQEPAAKHPA